MSVRLVDWIRRLVMNVLMLFLVCVMVVLFCVYLSKFYGLLVRRCECVSPFVI